MKLLCDRLMALQKLKEADGLVLDTINHSYWKRMKMTIEEKDLGAQAFKDSDFRVAAAAAGFLAADTITAAAAVLTAVATITATAAAVWLHIAFGAFSCCVLSYLCCGTCCASFLCAEISGKGFKHFQSRWSVGYVNEEHFWLCRRRHSTGRVRPTICFSSI